MAECENCGAFVTDKYARVFSPDEDARTVPTCPQCPDKIRTGSGETRSARAPRRNHHEDVDHSRSDGTKS